MSIVEVQVREDHLQKLTSCSPVAALIELIWNSLDADAVDVRVQTRENELGVLEQIRIIDNGHGLSFSDANEAFKNLGGSRKRHKHRTPGGRIYHGREGKGRFRAFRLGGYVKWDTVYKDNQLNKRFSIEGSKENLKRFEISGEQETEASTGTTIHISDINKPFILETDNNIQKITEEFALYLRQYTDTKICVAGSNINPADIEEEVSDYQLEIKIEDNIDLIFDLTIIEWSKNTKKTLYLCDKDGFTLHETAAGIQAPGFSFTAYLKSDYIRQLEQEGMLHVEDIHLNLKKILDAAKEKMREHFRIKTSQQAVDLVQSWKADEIYPYQGEPASPLEDAERQIFDVVALNVNEYLPDFEKSSSQSKRMQFKLLKNAIETSPSAIRSIIDDVLNLPYEKQEEFAELLGKTSLEAMINASRVVTDRLEFLKGLELLVFDKEFKKKTLERKQLHRIVANHTWIFGEEYNLAASDQTLTTVLKRHIDIIGADKELLDDESPVLRDDGSRGVIDLMLSRVIPQPDANKKHHLIIELKRPSVPIGNNEAGQIKDYAVAIAADDRFRDTDTRWDFWALSDDLSASVKMEANQTNRAPGLILDNDEKRIRIWVKTWGQVIDSCQARLRFFQEKLIYAPNEASGLGYLRKMHNSYLPKELMR
ncbi:ATP-binding protein [Nodosilinea sp. LEGE 07298]|uniref:ATP-binding protein n=1 Tax=Nodosilinea sp. LEGE 07298 TaxID=2777970 RepID=UPI00187F2CC1|nr:ATP-binding protein [Nodosilinea sp. LEGE 07298]MBE9108540.1 ATP-binding protein [Nodosilinea sp. LEGE 07298]